MLELRHIYKDYVTKQQTVKVLKNLDINFRDCEFVTILGQSGCGKTTLLNIVGGLDRYTSGDILINGKSTRDFDDRDWDRYRNKQIGFVFQNYQLIPHLSVLRNVELALTLAGKSREEREKRSLEVLRRVGLEDQAYKKPNQLSGGQMQRVAIARALVNNPDIIMADEPTGALDSDSGTMVMEILKEVAEDRLVILVTHNALLAEKYSTRTVILEDGRITSDSDPFEEESGYGEEYVHAVSPQSSGPCTEKSARRRLRKSYSQVQRERREERKVSMKEGTALSLSARNLMSKKWRTFLTSFAGSIGIIGVGLVLALSSGLSTYIAATEKSALSVYPLAISGTNFNLMEMANLLMTPSTGEQFPKAHRYLVSKVMGNALNENKIDEIIQPNNMEAIKKYLDKNMDKSDGYVSYTYPSKINVYRQIPHRLDVPDKGIKKGDLYDAYTKVNPFYDAFEGFLSGLDEVMPGGMKTMDQLLGQYKGYLQMFTVFSEMIDNAELLKSQYDVIAGKWPSPEARVEGDDLVFDCVLRVDTYNKIPDFMLLASGLVHPDEAMSMLSDKTWADNVSFGDEDFLGMEYRVLSDSDYFHDFPSSETRTPGSSVSKYKLDESRKEIIEAQSGIRMRISAVVRRKASVDAGSITGIIGFPHSLLEAVVARCQKSPVVSLQRDNWWGKTTKACTIDGREYAKDEDVRIEDIYSLPQENDKRLVKGVRCMNITNGNPISGTEDAEDNQGKAEDALSDFISGKGKFSIGEEGGMMPLGAGYAEIENPDQILIYASSFKGKEDIIKLLEAYKTSDENPTWSADDPDKALGVKYTDMLSVIMKYVKQMVNAMVSALIAFSAISLIVSSIMIAIITYTSVLERRKEIGILRSIGARKIDISNLFLSESTIIGVISGMLGIAFGYAFVAIANRVILALLAIENLLYLDWYLAVGLLIVSFFLSLIAGIIPASIAAKKDPVQCLRSE